MVRSTSKYARSGVREYWVVNLQKDVIDIFRSPQGEEYLDHTVAVIGDKIAPLAFLDTVVEVNEIIPPR